MGLLRYSFRSEALGYHVNVSIFYPSSAFTYMSDEEMEKVNPHLKGMRAPYRADAAFQCLYLMPGGGDDDTIPFRKTNIERYADKHKLMVVCPELSDGFGIDTPYGTKYFTFITEELTALMQGLFHASAKREDSFIAGFAMGANVALGCAILRPDLYSYCVDMSGGIGMTLSTKTMQAELDGDHFRSFFPRYNATFGEGKDFPGSPFDLYPAAKKHKDDGDELTNIVIACGSKEFIRERVEEDARILKELEYPVTYVLEEGYDHDYDMWDMELKRVCDEWLPLKDAIL